ncbi:MAG TPA: S53 family peptidase [Streptosporangiaceae bacterium]|nr:S53 family peptidase [Streptosporangiaceae bacterium]
MASAVPLALAFAAGSASAAPAGHAPIAGSAPSWAATAKVIGTPSASSRITFNVVLPLRHSAALDRLAIAVSSPKGASYGHYITPAQFNRRFGPTAAQAASVRSYLKGLGFTIKHVAQGNRWVTVSGSVRRIESAFGTTLRNYSYKGKTLRAASRPLSVAPSMAKLIAGFVGVGTEGTLRRPAIALNGGKVTPNDAPPPSQNCSAFWDEFEQVGPPAYGHTSFPTPNCGYTAAQLRSAYGMQGAVSHGDSGAGQTVAIIDAYASATIVADTNALADSQGEPELASGQFTETDMTPFDLQDECGPEGWNEEETLDVAAVHGLAPGANIHYIGAMDCDTGIDAAINFVLQNHTANIVSNSYGFAGEDGLGDEVATEDSMFRQAVVEGIGFYFSSGDDGDNVAIAGTPHPEPDFPASDPFVTAVGGTSLAVTSSNGYLFETSWGDDIDAVNFATSPSSYTVPPPGSFAFGGGGGVSTLFKEPIYQRLAVPASLATLNGSTRMRVVPDIAAVGDPETGLAFIFRGSPGVIGGTSLSCPVIAGIQALASQNRRFPIGFANPLLYVLDHAGKTFHDVKAPASTTAMITRSGRTLITMGLDSSLTSTKGYDDTTGLGTPNGAAFLLKEALLP